MIAHKKEYALYKGEELSKELGIKKTTLHFYASPAYDKRTNSEKARRLIEI